MNKQEQEQEEVEKPKLTRLRVCSNPECDYHTFVMKKHACRICRSKLYSVAFEEPQVDVDINEMIRHNLELFQKR